MFKLKFAEMYDNSIFAKYNEKPVVEDYFRANENTFCVADGVTRDSIYGEAVPYPQTKEEVEEWVRTYPNPSGAYEAAKICADQFLKYISEYKEDIGEKVIRDIVNKINSDIALINKDREIDYLANDLFCCVAVGGYIEGNNLYCFSIGDSHIMAFDKDLNLKFSTINTHKQFEDYLEIYQKTNPYDWKKAEDRIMVRRDFRNKPERKYNDKDVSFGVLSGEKEVDYYINTYKVDLSDVKYICAYSDGCEPFFKQKAEIRKIMENPYLIKEHGKERTLIIYESRA